MPRRVRTWRVAALGRELGTTSGGWTASPSFPRRNLRPLTRESRIDAGRAHEPGLRKSPRDTRRPPRLRRPLGGADLGASEFHRRVSTRLFARVLAWPGTTA